MTRRADRENAGKNGGGGGGCRRLGTKDDKRKKVVDFSKRSGSMKVSETMEA